MNNVTDILKFRLTARSCVMLVFAQKKTNDISNYTGYTVVYIIAKHRLAAH